MASDYPVNFHFKLSFKGEDAAFQEVTGISKEMKVEEVVSGGENRFKYKLPNGVTSPNLVLKRALVPVDSLLNLWIVYSLSGDLLLPMVTVPVMVSLLDKKGDTQVMWIFHDAYPVKYAVSDLKSNGNDVLIESIELAYSYFDVI
ncbi:MAG: phage tail protein [Flavobacteriales bacterium]|nr:MAG: phage tail protein [Flavobacteriales bacterium]